eukprot:gene2559-3521_t
MGIDLVAGGRNTSSKRQPQTTDIYTRLLIKLYTFLVRRTDSKFNKIVLKRLGQTRALKRPIPVARIAKFLKNRKGASDKIAVVVGTVTNDSRVMEVPKLQICALKFTETARRRIEEAGGKCLSFDQLAQIKPEGKGTLLFKGHRSDEKKKHHGAPGVPGSHAKPHVRSKGNNFERARGRRASRAYKVKS